LREIYIDAELDPVDTTSWYPKIQRKDFTVGLNVTETGVDDPDQQFYENYVCGSDRNYTGYCNPELDKMVDRQSMETDGIVRITWAWPPTGRRLRGCFRSPIVGTVSRPP